MRGLRGEDVKPQLDLSHQGLGSVVSGEPSKEPHSGRTKDPAFEHWSLERNSQPIHQVDCETERLDKKRIHLPPNRSPWVCSRRMEQE